MLYQQAHEAYQRSLLVAEFLADPELQASALARQGVTFIQQQQPVDAIESLQGALHVVNRQGLTCLRGYILQALSEAYAMNQQANLCWRHIDLAEHTLDRRGLVLERSYCYPNTSSMTTQKGVNAVLLHGNDRAIRLIDNALIKYDPTYLRGRARLIAQKAEAYVGMNYLDAGVSSAAEALTLAQAVGSSKTKARIANLHTFLLASRWKNEDTVKQLGVLLQYP